MKIKRIRIKNTSCYGCYDDMYEERFTIEADKIKYEYKPTVATETNPLKRWVYKSNTDSFNDLFNQLIQNLDSILDYETGYEQVCDANPTEFTVIYEDNTKHIVDIYFPEEKSPFFFNIMHKMVPSCEQTLSFFND